MTITTQLKPLWSFSFWLVISLYALNNNVLSLCMIMAIIALLVGRSQSFASRHLYWVWALLVHPTTKNQSANWVHHTYLYVVFHCHSKVNCLCATFKPSKLQLVLCFVLAHEEVLSALLSFHDFIPWLACIMCWSIILQKEQGNRVPIPNKI